MYNQFVRLGFRTWRLNKPDFNVTLPVLTFFESYAICVCENTNTKLQNAANDQIKSEIIAIFRGPQPKLECERGVERGGLSNTF